ncbi:unnamed protein product [Angiostrongylus costaricensis]|uniref:Transposase n=1 Tax=Angiostrongylus costaricensis TaxID=334426 RepID=A0A0R3PKH8_ANGCS|nr:unnamed protein product [Angiostrongylus costaricensis]
MQDFIMDLCRAPEKRERHGYEMHVDMVFLKHHRHQNIRMVDHLSAMDKCEVSGWPWTDGRRGSGGSTGWRTYGQSGATAFLCEKRVGVAI